MKGDLFLGALRGRSGSGSRLISPQEYLMVAMATSHLTQHPTKALINKGGGAMETN